VQRSEDECDMSKVSSFNCSTCNTVPDLLEAVYLRLGKIVVQKSTLKLLDVVVNAIT